MYPSNSYFLNTRQTRGCGWHFYLVHQSTPHLFFVDTEYIKKKLGLSRQEKYIHPGSKRQEQDKARNRESEMFYRHFLANYLEARNRESEMLHCWLVREGRIYKNRNVDFLTVNLHNLQLSVFRLCLLTNYLKKRLNYVPYLYLYLNFMYKRIGFNML